MTKREPRYDASCPSCGTPVVSLASRCKLCGASLAGQAALAAVRAPAPASPGVVGPDFDHERQRAAWPGKGPDFDHERQRAAWPGKGPGAATLVTAPPRADATPSDSIRRAADRRAEEDAAHAERPRRSWPIVVAVVGIVAVIGVATFLAVRSAIAGNGGGSSGGAGSVSKPGALPPIDPSLVPPAQRKSPSASNAAPSPPLPPGMPPRLIPMPPSVSGDPFDVDQFMQNPWTTPVMPGMPTMQDLMKGLGQGMRQGSPASPDALAFADKAMGLFCNKAAQCGLFDPGDKTTCQMVAETFLAAPMASALSSGSCKFDPVRAQGCLDIIQSIDCAGAGPFGGDPTQLMALMNRASACADVLACL